MDWGLEAGSAGGGASGAATDATAVDMLIVSCDCDCYCSYASRILGFLE